MDVGGQRPLGLDPWLRRGRGRAAPARTLSIRWSHSPISLIQGGQPHFHQDLGAFLFLG